MSNPQDVRLIYLAHLIGLDPTSIVYAFRRFPEEKRTTPAKNGRTLSAIGAPR